MNELQEEKIKLINFDNDLCLYTLNQSQELLNDIAIFPKVLNQLILEYCAIYRQDHMESYPFENFKQYKDIAQTTVNTKIQNYLMNNNDPIIWFGCGQVNNLFMECLSILFEYLIKKEIDYKDNNKFNFNVLIIYSRDKEFIIELFDTYKQKRKCLGEDWLIRDETADSKLDEFSVVTTNKFSVTLVNVRNIKEKHINSDLVITDFMTLGWKDSSNLLEKCYSTSKQIFFILQYDTNFIEDTQYYMKGYQQYNIQYIPIYEEPLVLYSKELCKTSYITTKSTFMYTKWMAKPSRPLL